MRQVAKRDRISLDQAVAFDTNGSKFSEVVHGRPERRCLHLTFSNEEVHSLLPIRPQSRQIVPAWRRRGVDV
jgi:hypothetical protein